MRVVELRLRVKGVGSWSLGSGCGVAGLRVWDFQV